MHLRKGNQHDYSINPIRNVKTIWKVLYYKYLFCSKAKVLEIMLFKHNFNEVFHCDYALYMFTYVFCYITKITYCIYRQVLVCIKLRKMYTI